MKRLSLLFLLPALCLAAAASPAAAATTIVLKPEAKTFGYNGAAARFTVYVTSDDPTVTSVTVDVAASDPDMITDLAVSNYGLVNLKKGKGTAKVSYRVQPYADSSPIRTETISVFADDAEEKSFTVTQNGKPCKVTVDPVRPANIEAAGMIGSFSVLAPEGCSWSIASKPEWVTVDTESGTGPAFVEYTVAGNIGKPRTGLLTVTSVDPVKGTVSSRKNVVFSQKKPLASLVGSWYVPYPNGGDAKGPIVFTFIDETNFMMAHDGDVVADPSGQPGIERGTYSWDPATGVITTNVVVDTNGDWGFAPSDEKPRLTVSADGTKLLLNGRAFANRVHDPANPLVGSWYVPYPDAGAAKGPLVVTFIDGSTFMMAHDGDSAADPTGQPGIERGTYTRDALTGAVTAVVQTDTNGDWGFSGNNGSITLSVSADGRSLLLEGNPFATRVGAASSPPPTLIGSWGGQDAGKTVVVTFLDNSNFVFSQQAEADSGGQSGIEVGTYSWNPATGSFNATITRADTNGDWGLSSPSPTGITVSGNTMTVTYPGEDGVRTLGRIVRSANTLVGGWGGQDADKTVVITFLDNSNFVFSQQAAADGGGQSGIEVGTYAWNAATGAFDATITRADTNGDWGFSTPSPTSISVSGSTLNVTYPGSDGTKTVRLIGTL